MSGNGIKYEKADFELPLATAEAVLYHDGNEDASNNLVTAIFDKPSKDSPLGIIWNIVNNEIVLTGFAKAGLAMTQPNNLEIGMTLMSVNGVSFVSGMAADGHHPEDVFSDEEEGPSSMGLVTEEAAVEASNIMRNAEGTLIIVARKNTKSAKSARNNNSINKKHKKRNVKKMTKANPRSSAPPPGAPEGGVWGSTLYYGPTSQLSSILCCLLGGLIPASIMCCLPFDKRRVYFANNRYYGEFGGVLGVGGDLRFLQEDPMQGTYNSDAATSSCCMAFGFIAVVIFIMMLMQTNQAQQANGYYHLSYGMQNNGYNFVEGAIHLVPCRRCFCF